MLTEQEKDYAREWVKKKRQANPEFRKIESQKARAWQLANPVRNALSTYKRRASRLGLAFDITDSDFETLVQSPCEYCGLEPAPVNGLDRLDSDFGYSYDNVVTACRQCNIAKNTYTVDEFLQWIERVYQHNGHI